MKLAKLEKLAIVLQGRNGNYDGVLDCVQRTTEGMTEARNNYLQLYKEAEEFVISWEEIDPIEKPREQKRKHRDFRPSEHILGKTQFDYYCRLCFEIFHTAVVSLQSRFNISKPGIKSYCDLYSSLLGPVLGDEEVKKYPEINFKELKQEHVISIKRWNNLSNLSEYVEILKKSSEEIKFFFPNIVMLVELLLLTSVSLQNANVHLAIWAVSKRG